MNSKGLTAGQKKQDAQDKLERLLLRGRAVHPLHWPQFICWSIKKETAETTTKHSMFTPVISIYILGKINKAHYGGFIVNAASMLAQWVF